MHTFVYPVKVNTPEAFVEAWIERCISVQWLVGMKQYVYQYIATAIHYNTA